MKNSVSRAVKSVSAVICAVILFSGCRPGYKEVWEEVKVPTLEWVENDDIDVISERIKTDILDEEIEIDEIIKIMKPDGTFDGFDYEIETRTDTWAPLEHLRAVEKLLIAYNSKGHPHYHDESIKAFTKKAISFWVENDFYCEWSGWNNTIGLGLTVPNILLLDDGDIAEKDREKLLEKIKSTLLQNSKKRFKLYEREVSEGGGNLTDQVNATLKVAVIENDGNTIMWLKSLLENELRPFPAYKGRNYHRWDAEGPKEDFSFQQHDQLLYYGGYGEVFVNGLNRYMRYTAGTQYMLNKKALDFYADFVAEGMQFSTRNGYRDINVSGRGIARQDGLKGIFSNIKEAVDMLLFYSDSFDNVSPDRVEKLKRMKAERFTDEDRGAGGHRYFYESDYNVYNTQKYMAGVRHASERTRVFEYLNYENPLGFYTGMGAAFYYIDGDEYFNLMPMYDWNKIPGTTTKQGKVPTMNQDSSYNRYGKTAQVGGVSNGKVGLSTFKQRDKGVHAQKGYFMFEDGVVCLASGIRSFSLNDILTNINQTLWKGDVFVGVDGKNEKVTSEFSGKAQYVYNNKISYITDSPVSLKLEKDKVGDWKTVYTIGESKKIKKDIFTLDINHGKLPMNESYAFTVLMNTSVEQTQSYINSPTLKVIENSKNIQAVYDEKNDVLEIIFIKAGELEVSGKKISCDAPCSMIIENLKTDCIITAASNDYETHEITISCGDFSKTAKITKRSAVIK